MMQRVIRAVCAAAGAMLWWYAFTHNLEWWTVALLCFAGFMLFGIDNFTWGHQKPELVKRPLVIAEPVHLATEGNPLIGYYVEGRFLPIPDTSWGWDGDEGPDEVPEFYWPPAPPKGGGQ